MTDEVNKVLMLQLGKTIDSIRVEGTGSIVRTVIIVMTDGQRLVITPYCYNNEASLVVERDMRTYVTPEEILPML